MSGPLDPAALRDLALEAATAAGDGLLQRWGSAGAVEAKTSPTDPVSEADAASERLLADLLLTARPDDGVLGEEGTEHRGQSGLRWVLDPLDGTVNYLYGLPEWCVSLACEDRAGQLLVGVVHAPAVGETFFAERDGGAVRGGAPIAVNDPVPLGQALVATGFSYRPEDRRRQGRAVAELLPQVRDIRRAGSCALDLCRLAAGQFDAYYEDTTNYWDWAAGSLIAREAGAIVEILAGPDGRSGVLAAGPGLFPTLRQTLGLPG